MLVQSVDEEYHNRAKSKIILIKMENTIFDIKYSMQLTKFKRKNKRTWLRFANFRYWFPKKQGILSNYGDAVILLSQDMLEQEGKPLNLANLNEIVSRRMEDKIERSIFLLDKIKR